MTIKIYVGDTHQELAFAAQAGDPTAFLIDYTNCQEFLTTQFDRDIVAYTCVGDLPNLEIFYNILFRADQIVYFPPAVWSDQTELDGLDPTQCIQGLTENALLFFSDRAPVENIELCLSKKDPVLLADVRRSDQAQLWSVGCSVTDGFGVDTEQRYGHLLANKLDLPCSFLTKSGSSLAWAADQILRSDIRAGDIVVWGLTETFRTQIIQDNNVTVINIGSYNKELSKIVPVELFYSWDTLYTGLYAIEQVYNFCQKMQVNLLLFGVLIAPNLLRYVKSKNNFFNFPHKLKFKKTSVSQSISNVYADLGTDNFHAGPLQHQLYADFCQSALKKLNYI
jgi:hypothetical protein